MFYFKKEGLYQINFNWVTAQEFVIVVVVFAVVFVVVGLVGGGGVVVVILFGHWNLTLKVGF